jgi:type III restriction enzyme
MAKISEFKFEENQQHQKEAIDAIVNLFNAYPQDNFDFTLSRDDEAIAGNIPDPDGDLGEQWLHGNYQDVISAYNESKMPRGYTWLDENMKEHTEDTKVRQLPLNSFVMCIEGYGLDGVDCPPAKFPVFTIEMETGTGKTYTYLRTIHELKKRYGFRKFIVVVPSIAIYEGTIAAFNQTKSHFNTLYENDNTNLVEYDGSRPDKVKGFANSQSIEILVMTMQSFNTAGLRGNNIYKRSDKLQSDLLPYQYIQRTRPILILDESQNYQTEKSKKALQTLNPLFAINYSATPVEKYNLVYRLSPVDAFLYNLVKKIKVLGVTQETNNNIGQIILKKIDKNLKATLQLPAIKDGKKIKTEITVKLHDDLYSKTGNSDFKGLVVGKISRREYGGELVFTNQEVLNMEISVEADITKREVYRVQIEETIKFHFERQELLRSRGIKVLSLFFIDHVANYKGNKPFIRELFEEAFEKLKIDNDDFNKYKAAEVHNGYFAQKKDFKTGDIQYIDEIADSEEGRRLEKEAYRLIMRDKQELLSFDSNISFIFAHSALREGWDNPNVFTICLLKEPRYETSNQMNTRRQELGRGLRICVNQEGERVKGDDVNILTVVCPEDFSEYVDALQNEYMATGDIVPPKPTNARTDKAIRNDSIFTSSGFTDFWKNISRETRYEIILNSPELVSRSIKAFNNKNLSIPEPKIILTKGDFIITSYAFELKEVSALGASILLTITNTHQRHNQYFRNDYPVGFDFGRYLKDKNLKGFKITQTSISKADPMVYFGNGKELKKDEPLIFNNKEAIAAEKEEINQEKHSYSVFNLIERAARVTNLTRPTLAKIFEAISAEKKSRIFYNPEGFSSIFINVVNDVLADLVAENIVYHVSDTDEEVNLTFMQHFFPPQKEFPQKELIPGSEHSLYNQIQIDSDVEECFVKNRLQSDDKKGNLIGYFKFPSDFKIHIPKVILNYNPDWGIIRLDKAGNKTLHLVRETKGNIDAGKLRFPNERRKILCAKKHFKVLGVSYRQITDKDEEWWLDDKEWEGE